MNVKLRSPYKSKKTPLRRVLYAFELGRVETCFGRPKNPASSWESRAAGARARAPIHSARSLRSVKERP